MIPINEAQITWNPWYGQQLARPDGFVYNMQYKDLLAVVNPYCPYCVQLKPVLTDLPGNVFVIDSSQHPKIVNQLNVRGVPALYTVEADQTLSPYTGPRDATNLRNICQRQQQGR